MASRALATIMALALPGAAAAAPVVATDIAPVHSIAARVMQGIGQPGRIVPPGASPHGYALRPSEARLLQDAALVVWVRPDLTPWLADPIDALAPDATLVTLQDAPGMTLLPIRAGGPFEAHEHDHEAEQAEADERAHAEAGHEAEHAGGHDGHLWLDPGNAAAAARAIAAALAAADPANAGAYAANAEGFAAETEAQAEAIAARLEPLRGRPFIVFHDAYQYFEHAFDFPAAGSIALQDGVTPGTARVAGIRDRVRDEDIVCAFSEPEFEPKLIATVIEGTAARTGVLDGVGAALSPGPGLYPALLDGIADGLAACLGG
jgi:zinc transport system substrate-binding protein